MNTDACVPADDYCNLMETTPYYNTGLNPYDIRVPCGDSSLCYDFTNIETYLNLNSTREALHVSDKVETWETCNTAVDVMFASDWMRNYQQVTFLYLRLHLSTPHCSELAPLGWRANYPECGVPCTHLAEVSPIFYPCNSTVQYHSPCLICLRDFSFRCVLSRHDRCWCPCSRAGCAC